MTTVKQALESAIELLKNRAYFDETHPPETMPLNAYANVYLECKSALAELESVEPVGYAVTGKLGERCSFRAIDVNKGDMVFTSPQTREWVGLSDDDVKELSGKVYREDYPLNGMIRLVEAKLRELNTKG